MSFASICKCFERLVLPNVEAVGGQHEHTNILGLLVLHYIPTFAAVGGTVVIQTGGWLVGQSGGRMVVRSGRHLVGGRAVGLGGVVVGRWEPCVLMVLQSGDSVN